MATKVSKPRVKKVKVEEPIVEPQPAEVVEPVIETPALPVAVKQDSSWEMVEINGRKFKKHFRPNGTTDLEGPIVE